MRLHIIMCSTIWRFLPVFNYFFSILAALESFCLTINSPLFDSANIKNTNWEHIWDQNRQLQLLCTYTSFPLNHRAKSIVIILQIVVNFDSSQFVSILWLLMRKQQARCTRNKYVPNQVISKKFSI